MPHSVTLIANPTTIPMDDPIIHTEGRPFCIDGSCPCHEDEENIKLLSDLIRAGVLTEQEAKQTMKGVTI